MIERWSLGWRPYALLLLLCLGLYVPGIAGLPVLDRDEARFAQATRQMLETGDFLRIRFLDEARNKKPAGIHWLQAAAVAALSSPESAAIWPYRLPSLAGATLAVMLTFGLGARLVGNVAALLGAALLASSLALVTEAHIAKTDAALLAAVVAAQGALGVIYYFARRGAAAATARWALLFWTAEAAAMLLKGPLAPLLALLTIAALAVADRDLRWLGALRLWWGLPLLLAIASPWFIAITVATDGGFLGEALGHDFVGKLLGAQEAHSAPPGSYLLLLALTFWPGSLLLGPALACGWRGRAAPVERFLAAWAVPFWLALEAVPTKLPHYILPVYPALALLAGRGIAAMAADAPLPPRRLEAAVTGLWIAATLAVAAALIALAARFGRLQDGAAVAAAAIALVFGLRLAIAAWRHPSPGVVARVVVLALLVFAPSFALVAPELGALWVSRAAAAAVARYQPPRDAPVVAAGYSEPSLAFLLGTKTRFVAADEAARYVTGARGAAALVSDREDDAFRRSLTALGWEPRRLDRIEGLDYSNGRHVVLTLYAGVPR
jgi:4-amino-4-deoxy-L-arabinose transferase-like glycosyltransferase